MKLNFTLLLILGFSHSAIAETLVFSDPTMSESDYTTFFFNGADLGGPGANPDDEGFLENVEDSSTGNPSPSLLLTHFHDVTRDGFGDPVGSSISSVQTFVRNTSVSYDPSVSGAAQSFRFVIELSTVGPFDELFFTIRSGGGTSPAIGPSGIGSFFTIDTSGDFEEYSVLEVTQDQAPFQDFSGSAPLTFGFGFTSEADVPIDFETFDIFVDNFQVFVTPVPEPSAFLFGIASLGLLARRRRHRV
ncbi:MAG: PEP-CTERM sorting domain-containing protein [Verrucomicrobiota bacterium]